MYGTSNLWTKWWRLCSQYFCSIPFHSLSWYKSSQYPFHLSTICVAWVKFSPVAYCIHCRRGRTRVIDLTIWKSCLEFPSELAAANSMHLPFICCCLSTLSFFVPQLLVLDIVLILPTQLCLSPPLGWPHRNFALNCGVRKLEYWGYRVALFPWSCVGLFCLQWTITRRQLYTALA